jgi:ribose transport system ATP-binding protein
MTVGAASPVPGQGALPQPSLVCRNVSKTFPGQRALDDLSLEIRPGRTHALLGHNGSGKSTLIKVLAGIHVADPGAKIDVAGKPLDLGSPRESRRLGLRFVHQDLGLVDELTAAENMALSWGYPRSMRLIRRGAHDERVRSALHRIGTPIDPSAPVGELRAVQRTAVAIARAIADVGDEIQVLVLDEPTASLPPAEVEALFAVIAEIRAQGVSVLYVSHRLDEVVEIADDVSVLRDGRLVHSGPLAGLGRNDLIRLILGGEPDAEEAAVDRGSSTTTAPVGAFEVEVSTARLRDVRLSVRAGEILGVAGLTGSGREEVCAAVGGAVPGHSRVRDLDRGVERERMTPALARDMGVALVLSNRAAAAAVLDFSIRENVSLPSLKAVSRWGVVRRAAERAQALAWIGKLDISPRQPEIAYALLSGGNQQKTVMSKWLAIQPRLLLLDDPTTGVDVGARTRIYGLIADQAEAGLPVVVASSDIEDLVAMCDRVVVLRHGQVSAEVAGAAVTEERLLRELSGGAE